MNKKNLKEIDKQTLPIEMFRKAEKNFIKDKFLTAVLFVNTTKKTLIVAFANMPEQAIARRMAMYQIGKKVKRDGLNANWIMLCTEAWYKKLEKDEEMVKDKVSDYSDKKEALIGTILYKDGKCDMVLKEIIRDGDKVRLINEREKSTEIKPFLLESFWQGYNKKVKV